MQEVGLQVDDWSQAFRQRTLEAKAFGVRGVFKEKRKHMRIEISEGGEKGRRGGQNFGG